MAWKTDRRRLVKMIQSELGLEDDLIIHEVENAENREEAISRLRSIVEDAQTALSIVENS